MPRPDYPKSRRILMQAVLCLVFAASIGLAALVTHQRRAGGNHLARMHYAGNIGLKLPPGWILLRTGPRPVLFVAVEPDSTEKRGRRLTVEMRTVNPALPPEEFLQSSGLLAGTFRPMPPADPSANIAAPIDIAGMPGVVLAVGKPVVGSATDMETQLFAASVRPSGLAISLRLDCPDDTDPDGDQQTLREIAAAMDVQDSASGR